MTFSPDLPIAETTADGKTRVRNVIRNVLPSPWEFSGEIRHAGEWIPMWWTGRGRAFVDRISGYDLRNTTAATVDWEKPIQYEGETDGHIYGLKFIAKDETRAVVRKTIIDKTSKLFGYSILVFPYLDGTIPNSKTRIINTPEKPPAPRTVEVQVAGARKKGQPDLQFYATRIAAGFSVWIQGFCHADIEEASQAGWIVSDEWQTVTLELPEVK